MHTRNSLAYVEEHELTLGDAYEIHSESVQRPVFTWTTESVTSIAPGASTVLEVRCLGKVGW